MAFDAVEQAAEEWGEGEGQKGDGDCGEDGPDDEGMPLPAPELAGESDGVFAGGVEELAGGERHGRGVEEAVAEADEGDDEDQLQRVDDVVAELRGGYVEAKGEGRGEAEDGGAAQDGVDADEEAGGDAPGQLFGRSTHAEQSEDGKGDAAVGPIVVDGGGVWVDAGGVWFDGVHC
jgi:hypothetical protein